MSRFDDTVRRMLETAAPEPPAGSGPRLVTDPPRRGRQVAPLWAAAIILVLAALLFGRTSLDRDRTGNHPAAPAGTKVLGYYGITVAVPAHFRVGSYFCAYPRVDLVHIATGELVNCPMIRTVSRPDPAHTTVTLAPFTGSRPPAGTTVHIDGVEAVRTATAIVVPSRGVSVTVRAPRAATTRAILDSVHVAGTDSLGCADKASPLQAGSNPSASRLVPGTPAGAVVCQYDATSGSYRLVGSRTLSAAEISRLVRELGPGTSGSPPDLAKSDGWLVRYRVRYDHGTTRLVDATLDADPGTATDGRRTSTVTVDLPRAVS